VDILAAHLIYMVPAAILTAILAAIIWSRKGPHPASYKMSDPWQHEPILWAAVDERVADAHGHGAKELTIGGGASGKW
jgi:hypothetical protein